MGILADSRDPDEIQHIAAFHQGGSALFVNIKLTTRDRSIS